MVDNDTFRKLALTFEESKEETHFDRVAFKVRKKIFATLDSKQKIAVLKLTKIDQSVFCAIDRSVIYPVDGAWGKNGWTNLDLKKVKKSVLVDVLRTAYCTVAPKKLALNYLKG